MWSVEVVVVDPEVKLDFTFSGVLVGSGTSPLAERGLDEAFRFAVGSRRVGSGEALPDVLAMERHLEVSVAMAGAVVGEDTADAEAEAAEVSPCPFLGAALD